MIPRPITSWSKNLFRYKTKPMVMDVVVADKTKSDERRKGWALQGHAQVNPALGTPCLGPMGLET
jgi:hypothetical protein